MTLTNEMDSITRRLENSQRVTLKTLPTVSKQQGVYALYYADVRRNMGICLKVGKAGPRRSDGLLGRLRLHFRSNQRNTVLARHMRADATYSEWRVLGLDFTQQDQRQEFLDKHCFFRVLPMPEYTEGELKRLEEHLEASLCPRYRGKVGRVYGEIK